MVEGIGLWLGLWTYAAIWWIIQGWLFALGGGLLGGLIFWRFVYVVAGVFRGVAVAVVGGGHVGAGWRFFLQVRRRVCFERVGEWNRMYGAAS
jgi:hypothetical protein